MRAGTPAHPGRTWLIMPPIALSGENARAPQGLPRAQGGLQPARATSRPRRRASPRRAEGISPTAGAGWRIYCSLSISPQAPHAGGDAARRADRQRQGCAVSACGRGRPRTQDAHGSLMLPTCRPSLSAVRTPEAPAGLPRTQRGLMVFESLFRHSPRRRASPRLAEGFSPTASSV
jgi:hypothetical protein